MRGEVRVAVATAEVEKVAARVVETEAATGAVRAVEMAVETEVAATVVEESAAAMEVEVRWRRWWWR